MLAILLIPAIIIHFIVCLLNIDSPLVLSFYEESYGIYNNFIFDLIRDKDDAIRFSGPFIEPGYLGMVTSYLLFANHFNIKRWPVLVLLIANIMTLSMAAYILTIIGLIFTMISSVKKFLYISLVLSVSIFLIFNSDNSIINEYVLSRLEFDEDTGISGNNRVTKGVYFYLSEMDTQKMLFGYGNSLDDDLTAKGSGILFYVMKCGIIGVVLWILTYMSLLHTSLDKKFAICMFFLMSISLIQRFYPAWFSWLLLYFYAVSSPAHKFHNKKIGINI